MQSDFKNAGKLITRNRLHVPRWVMRHRMTISTGLALLGDQIIPTFGDKPSVESWVIFLFGEASLLMAKRRAYMFALAYGLFGFGMNALRNSTGVGESPGARAILMTFAVLDWAWAARWPIGAAGAILRRHRNTGSQWLCVKAEHAKSETARSAYAFLGDALKKHGNSHDRNAACRRLCRFSNRMMPFFGTIATLLHIPAIYVAWRHGGHINRFIIGRHSVPVPRGLERSLGNPTNIVLVVGHTLWAGADAAAGRFGKAINFVRRGIGNRRTMIKSNFG